METKFIVKDIVSSEYFYMKDNVPAFDSQAQKAMQFNSYEEAHTKIMEEHALYPTVFIDRILEIPKVNYFEVQEKMKTADVKTKSFNLTVDQLAQIDSILMKKLLCHKHELKLQSRLKYDLGADDLDMVELVMELEKHFDIKILDDELERDLKVEDIYKIVASLLNNGKK